MFIPLPLGLRLVASVWFRYRGDNPVFYARADAAALATLAGLLLTLFLTAWYVAHGLPERARRAWLAHTQAQAAADRRRFLQRTDHKLKNPLTALRAALANLAGAPTDAARREALTSVETQAQCLSRLVADLRKLAELETRPIAHTPIDLTALLEEASGRSLLGSDDPSLLNSGCCRSPTEPAHPAVRNRARSGDRPEPEPYYGCKNTTDTLPTGPTSPAVTTPCARFFQP